MPDDPYIKIDTWDVAVAWLLAAICFALLLYVLCTGSISFE